MNVNQLPFEVAETATGHRRLEPTWARNLPARPASVRRNGQRCGRPCRTGRPDDRRTAMACGTPTAGTGPPVVVPQWSCGLRHGLCNGTDANERATDQGATTGSCGDRIHTPRPMTRPGLRLRRRIRECTGGLCLCPQRARRRRGVSREVAGQLPGPIVAIARRCDAAKRQPSWPRRSQGPQSG
jgi:hypothetical protein